MSSEHLDVVRSADADGLELAVDHLVSLGHRRIVHVGAAAGTIGADRHDGYVQAMRRNGLGSSVHTLPGDFTEDSGAAAAALLLGTGVGAVPTAVTAVNDRCAMGLLDGLNRAGVEVPAGVSVIGYDDSLFARLSHIGLTTVSQQPDQQARLAVTSAVERLDGGRTAPREVVLPPRLVVRGTTASPRPGASRPVPMSHGGLL